MSLFVTGLVLFFATHLVRTAAPGLRERMIQRLGPWVWKGLYSVVSVVGLVFIIGGYTQVKPYSPWLWSPPVWTRHTVALVMLPALILLLAAYLPGRIRSTVKHPMLIAVLLWSAAHLAANGQVADLMLFGSFLAWALIVTVSAFRREAASPPPSLPATGLNDVLAVVGGAIVWAWLAFGGHRILFGMPVFG